MMDLRIAGAAHIPALRALWTEAFGDAEDFLDAFFTGLYPKLTAFCAEDGGQVVAMAYAIPVTLCRGWDEAPGAYLYAVATAKSHRNRGICRELLTFAEETLEKKGVKCLLLTPADEGLARMYRRLGYRGKRPIADYLPAGAGHGRALACPVVDYAGLRETLLADRAHLRYGKAFLDFLAREDRLLRLELGGQLGCAAVRRDGDVLAVDELLPGPALLPALLADPLAQGAKRVKWSPSPEGAMTKWLCPELWKDSIYAPFALD